MIVFDQVGYLLYILVSYVYDILSSAKYFDHKKYHSCHDLLHKNIITFFLALSSSLDILSYIFDSILSILFILDDACWSHFEWNEFGIESEFFIKI